MSESPKSAGASTGGMLLVLGGVVVLLFIGALVIYTNLSSPAQPSGAARPVATTNPFAAFTTVRNDCGLCGTDSPIGGWETEDGRTLVLNEDRSFVAVFDDGSSMLGNWVMADGRLCLSPSTGGQSCFDYEQRVDAMMLDDGIYIRR